MAYVGSMCTWWRKLSKQVITSRTILLPSRHCKSRRLHRCCVVLNEADPIPIPKPDGAPKEYSEKIRKLVDDISNLTLKETSDLNELLKETLNISDLPAMMPAIAVQGGQQQETTEKKEEQTEFTVKLTRYADDSKIKVIKEVKNLMEGLNLVQAKKLVEGCPQVIKKDVSKEEAEKLRNALEAVGGVVEVE